MMFFIQPKKVIIIEGNGSSSRKGKIPLRTTSRKREAQSDEGRMGQNKSIVEKKLQSIKREMLTVEIQRN
jgi:hypothetical protein